MDLKQKTSSLWLVIIIAWNVSVLWCYLHDSVKVLYSFIVWLSRYQVSSLDYGEEENPVSNLYFYVEEEQGGVYRILRNEVCTCHYNHNYNLVIGDPLAMLTMLSMV